VHVFVKEERRKKLERTKQTKQQSWREKETLKSSSSNPLCFLLPASCFTLPPSITLFYSLPPTATTAAAATTSSFLPAKVYTNQPANQHRSHSWKNKKQQTQKPDPPMSW
jgi:hypothetical protein